MAENGLHDHVGYWLRRLSDEVHTAFERQLATRDLTVAQWSVLVTVYHGHATTTTAAAKFIGIDPGAVSRLVDRLSAKGLMTRSPDPASRRRVQLELTARGRALVPSLIGIADRNDATFFEALTPKERAALLSALKRLLPAKPSDTKEASHA